MLAKIFSTSLIAPLEFAKWTFVVLFVASTVGVIVGVYWEGDGFEKEKQHRGWRLLLRSLAAETAFGIMIFLTDGWISEIQRHEIISLRLQTATRDISLEEMKEISARLSKFAGQPAKIVVYPVNFESNWIAGKVYGILLDAHWKLTPPELLSVPPGNGGFMVSGIWVDHSDDQGSLQAADDLRDILNSTIAVANGRRAGPGIVPGTFDPASPIVWIFVGDKPEPLSSWVRP